MAFSRSAGMVTGVVLSAGIWTLAAQQAPPAANAAQTPADDPIRTIVGRLELEKYKATIKGLTQFGDRRQGTKRNRDALDWIEAQLKSYGCTNTERITYMHPSEGARDPEAGQRGGAGGGQRAGGQGGGQGRQGAAGAGQTGAAQTGAAGQAAAGEAGAGAGGRQGGGGRGQVLGPLKEPVRNSSGGSTLYGSRGRTAVCTVPATAESPSAGHAPR